MLKCTKSPSSNNTSYTDVTLAISKDFDVLKAPVKSFSDKKEYKYVS